MKNALKKPKTKSKRSKKLNSEIKNALGFWQAFEAEVHKNPKKLQKQRAEAPKKLQKRKKQPIFPKQNRAEAPKKTNKDQKQPTIHGQSLLQKPNITPSNGEKCREMTIDEKVQKCTSASPWLSVPALASYLSISKETVYRLLERKKVPSYRIGELHRFHKEEIDNWVKENFKNK